MTARDEVLQNMSKLKPHSKVFHQGKRLRECGLTVDGHDDKYHEHTVAQLRELLTAAVPVETASTAGPILEPGDTFLESADGTQSESE